MKTRLVKSAPWPFVKLLEDYTIDKIKWVEYKKVPGIKAINCYLEFSGEEIVLEEPKIEIDLLSLSKKELQDLAIEKGYDIKGLNKPDLIKLLG